MIKERLILTKEDALKESFMVQDIAGILKELNSYAKIVELAYGEYDENLKKEFNDYFAYRKTDNTVFCITACLSKKEFPESEYYLYEHEKTEGKKPLPLKEYLERDSKLLTECGFVNVNDFIDYECKVAFIYPNAPGLQVIEKMNELMSESEKEKQNKMGFEIKSEVNNGYGPNALTVIDKETGVNYIVIGMGGNISVTPRLNPDGSLYVSK